MTDALIGSMIPDGDRGTVRIEDRFDTDIADLWDAVTDPDRVARWIAVVSGDFRVGGTLTGRFTSSWEGEMRVEVCDAPRHLRLLSGVGDDQTVMEAWLSEDGDGTRLVVEESGLPIENLPYHGSGWQVHIEDLGAHLDGRPVSNWEQRWKALLPEYIAARQPE
jgi:uncharacterized protein YndB with AHSA1/START domain